MNDDQNPFPNQIEWQEYNRIYLAKKINELKEILKNYIETINSKQQQQQPPHHNNNNNNSQETIIDIYSDIDIENNEKKFTNTSRRMRSGEKKDILSYPPALDTICSLFQLSEFEKNILILCAGVELDSEISRLCSLIYHYSNSNNNQLDSTFNGFVTFGLVLAILPGSHWDAITQTSPLRNYNLIEIYRPPQTNFTSSILHIDEGILNFLVGVSTLGYEFQDIVEPIKVSENTTSNIMIVESYLELTEQILNNIHNSNQEKGLLPKVQLWGEGDKFSKLNIVARVCKNIGLNLWHLPGDLVPIHGEEKKLFIKNWIRDSVLIGAALYISTEDIIDPIIQKSIKRLVEQLPGIVFLTSNEPWSLLNENYHEKKLLSFEVLKPKRNEQIQLWRDLLGSQYVDKLDNDIIKIVNQFDLDASSIRNAVNNILSQLIINNRDFKNEKAGYDEQNYEVLRQSLWDSSRKAARPQIASFANQITPSETMENLILPEKQKKLLQDIIIQAKNMKMVYEQWGFISSKGSGSRLGGLSALFYGESGTGKTMAAEVIANELKIDLFRIDLSIVVSKYIGETEKNLRQVFDAAEAGGCVLFFDEADALFGKRSEVTTAHDRYANIEVGYLLQRMETYRGIVILATNMKSALDPAFVRRLRFFVAFPFPDKKSRERIWENSIPRTIPKDKLDIEELSKMNISGGSIRNISLNASFLAANDGIPVNMDHLRYSSESEYEKLERPLTKSEMEWKYNR